MLPSPNALRKQVKRAGMTYLKSVEFGESYSITLRRWHDAFNKAWPEIKNDSFDQRFKNMWDFYLTSCASGFHYGTTDVTQLTIGRPK
jgi:cyclopropane-fatty-acyl-phospholipid synthase